MKKEAIMKKVAEDRKKQVDLRHQAELQNYGRRHYDYCDYTMRQLDEEGARLDVLAKAANSVVDLLENSQPDLSYTGCNMLEDLVDPLKELLGDTLFLALSHVEDAIGDIEAVSERAHERAHTYR